MSLLAEPWKNPRTWALAVPAVVVVGLLIWTLMPYTGDAILLETRPRDPNDPFRGDYQALRYQISTLDSSVAGVSDLLGSPIETPVYVTLVPGTVDSPSGKPYWVAVEAGHEFVPHEGAVCLRGTVTSASGSLNLKYGIEAYFVQKDQDFHEWQGKTVSVVAKVRDCTARLAEIQLNGKTWDG